MSGEINLKKHFLTYLLLAGLIASIVALIVQHQSNPFPGNQEGYQPTQPIAYSHKLHAGDLEINCLYCHYGATKGPHAGIPPSELCMNCHRITTASWDVIRAEAEKAVQEKRPPTRIVSKQLQKLYNALGLDETLKPNDNKKKEPIQWVKVHNLPEYTRFDHRAHVNAGVKCQECHGPVQTMEVIKQSASLSMGWCVRCHKDHKPIEGKKVSPSTDCATCHY
jgi:Cytochrome c7 and related cytochrome c